MNKLVFHLLALAIVVMITGCPTDPLPEYQSPDRTGNTVDQDTVFIPESNPDGDDFYKQGDLIVGDLYAEIYYPANYDPSNKYPIFYFNDGDLMFNIFGRLTSLDLEPFIMVGISGNNSRRERFLPYLDETLDTYTPKADEYSAAIVNELIPAVEAELSIDPNRRAIFGISFGGIHATWIAWQYPEVFTFSAAISPSYWVNNGEIFTEDIRHLKPDGSLSTSSTKFYFDRGTAEWYPIYPMIDKLEDIGLRYGRDIFYYEVLGGAHDNRSWSIRIDVPVRLFLDGALPVDDLQADAECIRFNGLHPRIAPRVILSNGATYSVNKFASYEVIEGDGRVSPEGIYLVEGGTEMTVRVNYQGFSDDVTVQACR